MLKKLKTKILFIVCCICIMNVLPVNTVQAANTNKKTLTFKIDEDNPIYDCKFKLSKTSKLNVQVKILNMSGKTGNKRIWWAYYQTNMGKGSLFEYRKASELKKNKTLKFTEFLNFPPRYGHVTFDLPEGVKKMKIKITISTADRKKTIKSFKKQAKKYLF